MGQRTKWVKLRVYTTDKTESVEVVVDEVFFNAHKNEKWRCRKIKGGPKWLIEAYSKKHKQTLTLARWVMDDPKGKYRRINTDGYDFRKSNLSQRKVKNTIKRVGSVEVLATGTGNPFSTGNTQKLK